MKREWTNSIYMESLDGSSLNEASAILVSARKMRFLKSTYFAHIKPCKAVKSIQANRVWWAKKIHCILTVRLLYGFKWFYTAIITLSTVDSNSRTNNSFCDPQIVILGLVVNFTIQSLNPSVGSGYINNKLYINCCIKVDTIYSTLYNVYHTSLYCMLSFN